MLRAAMIAIRKLYADTSVSRADTKRKLLEIQHEVELLIDTLADVEVD